MKKGKLIVFYGINNLGKSTQAKKLVKRLVSEGYKAEYLKYALYHVPPAGPMINAYLREGNPYDLSLREVQILYAFDRLQYQPELEEKLASGVHIVAEDYVGTGLAWGIGGGVDESFLREINSKLYKEDIAFLFQGKRFVGSIEKGHKHETNDKLTSNVAKTHDRLGKEFGWVPVNANRSIEDIHNDIYNTVKSFL